MRKKIAIALTAGVAAATVGFGATGTASAEKPAGITCMQYGLGVLRSVGAPAKVSIDVVGLPLNQVLALHRNDPAAAGAVLKSLPVGLEADVVDAACPPA